MALPTAASVFRRIDFSADGILTRDEVKQAAVKAHGDNGRFVDDRAVEAFTGAVIDKFDQDSDGQVGEAEFQKSLVGLTIRVGGGEDGGWKFAQAVLDLADNDANGAISVDEVDAIGQAMGAEAGVDWAIGVTVFDLLDENDDHLLTMDELRSFTTDVKTLPGRPSPPT